MVHIRICGSVVPCEDSEPMNDIGGFLDRHFADDDTTDSLDYDSQAYEQHLHEVGL